MIRIDDLNDKAVLITGASSGIGAAVARAFGAQRAKVAVHWHKGEAAAARVAADIEAAGGRAVLVQADLTRSGEPQRVVAEVSDTFRGLDVLINCAGGLVSRRPVLEADGAWIDQVFDLNARTVIGTCQAAASHLMRRGGGAIINVGSIAGIDGGGPGAGIYGSSKAFVHNLTRHLARELAHRNIRVNTVSPGVVETPFHAATPAERMEAMRKSVSLGRLGTPADCVGAFLFLASAELSGYITGQIVHVNGGQVMP